MRNQCRNGPKGPFLYKNQAKFDVLTLFCCKTERLAFFLKFILASSELLPIMRHH